MAVALSIPFSVHPVWSLDAPAAVSTSRARKAHVASVPAAPGTWCAAGPQVLPIKWTHEFKWFSERHQEQVREDFERNTIN